MIESAPISAGARDIHPSRWGGELEPVAQLGGLCTHQAGPRARPSCIVLQFVLGQPVVSTQGGVLGFSTTSTSYSRVVGVVCVCLPVGRSTLRLLVRSHGDRDSVGLGFRRFSTSSEASGRHWQQPVESGRFRTDGSEILFSCGCEGLGEHLWDGGT